MTDYDPETADLFDKLWDARVERVDAQLLRIRNAAYWLGKQVKNHEVTKTDVDRRLRALCTHSGVDADDWVPWDMAWEVAVAALAEGMSQ